MASERRCQESGDGRWRGREGGGGGVDRRVREEERQRGNERSLWKVMEDEERRGKKGEKVKRRGKR